MFSNLKLTALLTLLLLTGCAKDPFDDITLATHVIPGQDIDAIKCELRPGYPVRGALKDGTAFRLDVKAVDKTAIHGILGEKIRFDKLGYVEYISPVDRTLTSRACQLLLAALAALMATIMAVAAAIDWVIRFFSGS